MTPDRDTERSPAASDRPAPALRLFLLGRFEVVRAGAPVPAQAWRRRRPADLLKLVALAAIEEGLAAAGAGRPEEPAALAAERGGLRLRALTLLHAAIARNRLAAGAPLAAEDALRGASPVAARHGLCAACEAALRPEAVRVALASLGLRAEAGRAARLELELLGHGAVAPALRALATLLAPGVG